MAANDSISNSNDSSNNDSSSSMSPSPVRNSQQAVPWAENTRAAAISTAPEDQWIEFSPDGMMLMLYPERIPAGGLKIDSFTRQLNLYGFSKRRAEEGDAPTARRFVHRAGHFFRNAPPASIAKVRRKRTGRAAAAQPARGAGTGARTPADAEDAAATTAAAAGTDGALLVVPDDLEAAGIDAMPASARSALKRQLVSAMDCVVETRASMGRLETVMAAYLSALQQAERDAPAAPPRREVAADDPMAE